jgi:RimJ/RimL family protein N-acetyltransferase
MKIYIRLLNPDDWQEYRQLRLHAIKTEPHFYSVDPREENQRNEEGWKNILADTQRAIFGLYDGNNLTGMTSVFIRKEDQETGTAWFGGTFIMPEYRGRGLAHMLYKARLDWAVNHPSLKQLKLSHRKNNVVSRNAHRKYGFQLTGVMQRQWSDGQTDDEEFYVLELPPRV